MGARRDTACHRLGWIDPKRFGPLNVRGCRIAMREHEPRHSIGQRRLADALRPADQPGMRNAPAAVGIQQCGFGFAMPCQDAGLSRMDGCNLLLNLTGAHAEVTALSARAVKKRS